MAPVFGYWNIRGLGQAIRLLLAHVGAEYDEKRYTLGPGPEFDRSSWLNEKYNFGLDFPNIPYYIDGNLKISQSVAIMKHLGRKYGLDGSNEDELVGLDILCSVWADIRAAFITICYSEYERSKGNFMKYQSTMLKQLSDYLDTSSWFIGEKMTYVDFILYELLDVLSTHEPTCLDDHKNLTEFLTRFQNLPNISKYMESDKFIKYPIMARSAAWGGN